MKVSPPGSNIFQPSLGFVWILRGKVAQLLRQSEFKKKKRPWIKVFLKGWKWKNPSPADHVWILMPTPKHGAAETWVNPSSLGWLMLRSFAWIIISKPLYCPTTTRRSQRCILTASNSPKFDFSTHFFSRSKTSKNHFTSSFFCSSKKPRKKRFRWNHLPKRRTRGSPDLACCRQ